VPGADALDGGDTPPFQFRQACVKLHFKDMAGAEW